MTEERENIIEKAIKIRELANRGIGGEKTTAIKKFEEYKEKYEITDDELNKFSSIETDWYRNTTEEERSEGFTKWFKKSVAVDYKTGKPIKFYHISRTQEMFYEFSNELGTKLYDDNSAYGFHFVDEEDKYQVKHVGRTYLGSGVEFYVYLNMVNPYYIYARVNGESYGQDGEQYRPIAIFQSLVESLIEKGFDSIIIQAEVGANMYIVFKPNQIKSVNNNGDFNPENNNICG